MKGKTLILVLTVGMWVVLQWPSNNVNLVFCDVGQGDATLVTKGLVQVLIDGGPGSNGVMQCLSDNMPFWDRKIEMVVNTHADKDHIGGLDEVVDSYEVGLLVVGSPGKNTDYMNTVSEIRENGIKVYIPKAGDRLTVGGISFVVLWPVDLYDELGLVWKGEMSSQVLGLSTEDLNEKSIVMRLAYGEFTAMFTGDIGEKEEQALVGAGVIMPVTVLKVPHHGSKYSSSMNFVTAIKPQLAVIEVGGNNTYGHPSGDITKRYDMVGSRLMRTDIHGQTVVTTNGKSWWVNYENED